MSLDILASIISGLAALVSVIAAVAKAITLRRQGNGKDRNN
jgi:hypothetical protein